MKSTFIAVGNTAEHSGFIAEQDAADIWRTNENENGWTYQDVCGPYGHVLIESNTKKEAQKVLNTFLECDAVKEGRYCYTHNPNKK